MAGEVNYGLVNPAVLDYSGQEQKALNVQKSRIDVERLEQERRLMLDMQKKLADSGQNPDLNFVFDTMIKSGNPDYMAKGAEGKAKLKEQQEYEQVRSKWAPSGGGNIPAPTAPGSYGAPMAPTSGAAPTNALAPMAGARQPAANANALAAPAPAYDEGERIKAEINDYLALGTPRALKMAEFLQKQYESLAPTASIKEYKFGQTDPRFINYQLQQKRAGATQVNMPVQEKEFEKELGSGQAKAILKAREGAEDAASILATNEIGRQILNSGAITGAGADFFVGLNQGLKTAGIDAGYGDAAANSQAYAATMASNVGKLIKQYGAGTGLSDADREFATKAAAGSINMDEKAIRRVLDINDRAARNLVNGYNKKVEGIKTNIPLKVEAPGGKKITSDAEYNALPSGTTFTAPDGTIRRKP